MSTQQFHLSDLARLDAEVWFTSFATLKAKDGKMIRAPKPNVLQKRMLQHYRQCQADRVPCKMAILKPRQTGASTVTQAIMYHHMRKYAGLSGSIMGDIAGTSDKVFEIFRRFAENDDFPWEGPATKRLSDNGSLTDDITLPNGSKYAKETAGSKNAGRSGTIQAGNMTEVAFWQAHGLNDPALGYLQSLYDGGPESLAIADSTPNGPQGWFYNICTRSSEWKFIFAAWFEFTEYSTKFSSVSEEREFTASLEPAEIAEQERFKLTPEQLNWRRRTIQNKCDGNEDKFRQEYPSDPEECFLRSARPRFHLTKLAELEKAAAPCQPTIGNLELQTGKIALWRPDDGGSIQRWEEPRTECRYLVAVDTCTGEDQQIGGTSSDPDYHSIQVWRDGYRDESGDFHKPRLVARHHSRWDVGEASNEVANLSRYFGNCLVVPEVNNSGLAMVRYLIDAGINVYRRRKITDTTGMVERAYGWMTDRTTRKTIIDNLATALVNEELDIPSGDVLREMKNFVVNKAGKPEAAAGFKDDDVLCAAIAVFNLDGATLLRDRPVRKISVSRLARDPNYMCPDGFSRRR